MKTPDEIKTAAATCITRPKDSACNRLEFYKECNGDCRYIIKELYDLVLKLESSLAQVERERDAAVFDLSQESCRCCKHVKCSSDEYPCNRCRTFKYPYYFARGNYEWRGICEENTNDKP